MNRDPEAPLKQSLRSAPPTGATLDRLWAGVRRRERAARTRRVAGVVGALVAVVGLVGLGWVRVHAGSPATPATTLLAEGLADVPGGQVQLEPGAHATLVGHTVVVEHGVARLVVHSKTEVQVAGVRLEVAAARVRIEAGEHGVALVVEEGEVVVRARADAEPLVVRGGQTWSNQPESWRALAQRGALAEAWLALGPEGVRVASAGASAEDRTLLADIASAGHALPLAIGVLESVVADGSAPSVDRAVAAYDLGLRRLEHGEPKRAAEAFEQSLSLQLPVALQADARARAAEAWIRAGDHARARSFLQ